MPGIRIFPTNAPKDVKGNFIIYYRKSTEWQKDLSGFVKNQSINYIINVMGESYEEMYNMREAVEGLLRDMISAYIGENDEILVNDVELNNIGEIHEFHLGLYRGIVDFVVFI